VHAWELIEPINLVPKLKGKEILLYYGKKDEIIPAKQAELLIDVFKENNVEYQIKSNSIFKHIPTLLINLLNFSVWVSFLKQ
jgi:predicted esterase